MLPDRVSNPGPLTYMSGALPIALRGPAPQGQQLCQIALKPMYYCTSYGPDKSRRTHGYTDAHTYRSFVKKWRAKIDLISLLLNTFSGKLCILLSIAHTN